MPRIVLPKFSHHIMQRGRNRQFVFAEDAEYVRYLETLKEFKSQSVRPCNADS